VFDDRLQEAGEDCILLVVKRRRKDGRDMPPRPGFEPRSGHMVFVVDKVEIGQVFSEYFSFPCQLSFHRLLHIHRHLSSGTVTTGQLVADVPSGLSLTPPQEWMVDIRNAYTVHFCLSGRSGTESICTAESNGAVILPRMEKCAENWWNDKW
jgi:hypothetical protein